MKLIRITIGQNFNPISISVKLVAGSVIATTGRDPTLAVAAARNALENNFAGPVPLPELGQIPVEIQEGALKTIGDVKETAGEVYDDIRKNPDEYAKEFVLDAIPYATIAEKIAKGESVGKVEVAVETVCALTGTTEFKAVAKTGAKVLGKTVSKFAKKMERGGRTGNIRKSVKVEDPGFGRNWEEIDGRISQCTRASRSC